MINRRMISKTISAVLALVLCMALASGCAAEPQAERAVPPHQTPEKAENSADEEPINNELTVYIPADRTDIAALLERTAEMDGIALTVSSPPRGAEYGAALSEVLNGASPPDVFFLEDLNSVTAADTGTAVNLLKESGQMLRALAGMSPLESAALSEGEVIGLPLGYYTEGYLADLALLADLFNTEDRVTLERDLVGCSWNEWQTLAMMFEDYLQRPRGLTITLNGNRYTTAGFRPQSARQLRGVFAVADGDNGVSLLNQLLASTVGLGYTSFNEMNADDAEYKAIVMQPAFVALFGLLDLETMYMARTGGATYRGEGYDNAGSPDEEGALEQVVSGAALFGRGDSRVGAELCLQDPTWSDRLVLIPIKLPPPEAEEGEGASGTVPEDAAAAAKAEMLRQLDQAVAGILAENNRRPWYASDGYLCVGAGQGQNGVAETLLLRLFASAEGRRAIAEELQLQPYTQVYPDGLLQKQVQTAAANDDGNLLPGRDSALSQQGALIGAFVTGELMTVGEWGAAEQAAFVNECLYAFGLPQNPVEEVET